MPTLLCVCSLPPCPAVCAGLAFNARFISHATCAASRPATTTCLSEPAHEGYGVINKPGVGFHNYNTLVASSGLDRTISSANSFLAGVFPRPHSNSSAVGLQVGATAHRLGEAARQVDYLLRSLLAVPCRLFRLCTPRQNARTGESGATPNVLRTRSG
jgi:hypothetical protein